LRGIGEILPAAFAGDGCAGIRKTNGRRECPSCRPQDDRGHRVHLPRAEQRRLALAISAAILSALAFARVADDYLTNDPLARWDVSFARWLSGERSSVGTDFFRLLSFIGSPAVALAIGTLACVVLYRRRYLVEAALLPVVLGGSELLNLILKLSFHRTRPEVAFVDLDT
jgi:hypothetical protein